MRHGRGRRVAVILHGQHDLFHRHAETLGGGLDDANVRLVRHEPVDLVLTDAGNFQRLLRHVAERLDGDLEYFPLPSIRMPTASVPAMARLFDGPTG